MEVRIQGRSIELSQETLDYVEKKLQRIQRRARLPMRSHVVVTREHTRSQTQSVVVEVTLNCNGSLLRVEERAATAQAAVDAAAAVLDRRVAHYKGKLYRSQVNRKTGQALSLKDMESPSEASSEPASPDPSQEGRSMELPLGRQVVRVKSFPMPPMTVAEAAQQMELLDHTFYLFRNRATHALNLLYRRWDGDYGLIEPGGE
jgi:putative sigma-54 modulation protein